MLPKEIVNSRARELRKIIQTKTEIFFNSLVGTKQKVLIEKDNSGYTPQFAKVKFDEILKPGKIIDAKIIKSHQTFIEGSF